MTKWTKCKGNIDGKRQTDRGQRERGRYRVFKTKETYIEIWI